MGLFTSSNPVLSMLKADHEKVNALFAEFKEAKDARTKDRIVRETLRELEVHAKLEETLIYPAIRREIDADDTMDEALEEHHLAHTLINELKRMTPGDERFAAKFTVLGESIKHHVQQEEGQMFPQAEEADLPWDDLQQQAMKRKEALLARPMAPTSKRTSRSRSGKRRSSRSGKSGRKSGRRPHAAAKR
jgi:hemerythrin superfamily protein